MGPFFEQFVIYSVVILICAIVVFIFLREQRRQSKIVEAKIIKAKEDGLFEPVSLHPVVNPNSCISTGACISACPEKDILGIVNGKATPVNASQCIGHGACFLACPTQAITLCIGTEKRGVELPHVNEFFETNIKGIYIAGELGGMGLIKNSVEQGKQAVENISKTIKPSKGEIFDLIVVGAGPAGISASLAAKKHSLNCLTLEQDSLGGTVYTFPRKKIVMTAPMDLPIYGKVKLFETSKSELLELWNKVIKENNINIKENSKVDAIAKEYDYFKVTTLNGETYKTKTVLLALGRRGTPRKLDVPGEVSEKVAYRLLEPEAIDGKNIVVVGGGDSAIESALLLADQNKVTISYRKDVFNRLKPDNRTRIRQAIDSGKVKVQFNSNIVHIEQDYVNLKKGDEVIEKLENDLVYIFAGGELPTQFLQKVGLEITKKHGEAILKHS